MFKYKKFREVLYDHFFILFSIKKSIHSFIHAFAFQKSLLSALRGVLALERGHMTGTDQSTSTITVSL